MHPAWRIGIPRSVLGLAFVVPAVNYFSDSLLGWSLFQPAVTDQGRQFAGSIIAIGYLWPLMKAINLVAGTCLLLNRIPAFAVAVLVPITVVIAWFQLTLNPLPTPLATVALIVVCETILIRAYAGAYAGMFGRHVSP